MKLKNLFAQARPFQQLMLIILLFLICLLAASLVEILLIIPIFGLDTFMLATNGGIMSAPNSVAVLKYMQGVQSVGAFVLPPLVFAYLVSDKISTFLYLNKKPLFSSVCVAILITLASSPLINVIGEWNANIKLPEFLSWIETWMQQKEEAAAALTEMFVHTNTIWGLLINIIVIAAIPALGEELLFRGAIQRIFLSWTRNYHMAIWISAIIFSAFHMQFFGFVPRMLLGALFGYLLVWSKSLWLPIVAHFTNNAIAVIAYFMYDKGRIDTNPDEIGLNTSWGYAAIISAIVVAALVYHVWKTEKTKQKA